MLMHAQAQPGARTRQFYVAALRVLDDAHLDYVVGGGYAIAHYTGIPRDTKDLDIFVRETDHRQILQTFERAGYRTEYFFPFWIAKALQGDEFIDILYNSGNGQCVVDDDWFTNAREAEILGYQTRLIPPEEQLWSKAFVQDRDRFDGADIHHLILHQGETFDWQRLLRRFAGHERVLLAHLLAYDYAFPTEPEKIPDWVMHRLLDDARSRPAASEAVCYGPNISQKGYLHHIRNGTFADGRLRPHGPLTLDQLRQLPEH